MAPGHPYQPPSASPPSVGTAGIPPATCLAATPAPSTPALPTISFLPPLAAFSLPPISPLPLPLTAAPPLAHAPLSLVHLMPSSYPPPAGVAQRAMVVVLAFYYWYGVRVTNMKFLLKSDYGFPLPYIQKSFRMDLRVWS